MIESRSKPIATSKSRLASQQGFTLVGAVISIGLVAVAVMMNVLLMGSIFNTRSEHAERHEFEAHLDEITTQLDNFGVCESMFASFGPGFKVETLITPRDVPEINLPPSTAPIMKVGRPEFNNTVVITEAKLRLPYPVVVGPLATDRYPLAAYLWMDLLFEYHQNIKGVDTIVHKVTKQILYEVALSPKDPVTGAGGGVFVAGACTDYIKKYQLHAKKMMCFIMGMHADKDGNCPLSESDGIRDTACSLTGYKYGGRYCDTSNPL
jgi:hypothetical protein